MQLLQIYLPGCDVTLEPPREVRIKDRTRRDAQKAFRHGEPVYQVSSSAIEDAISTSRDKFSKNTMFVVAPHLFSEDFDWIYSGNASVGSAIVSTHVLLDEEVFPCRIRTRVLSSTILSRVLFDFFELEDCENARCAMQLCDTLMELVDQEPVLCPTCLRKLQLAGIIRDVPSFLAKLQELLSTLEI